MSGWPRRGGWLESAYSRPSGLAGRATDREVGVVAVLVAGSEKAAAHRLGLSHSTVKHHLANARSKLGATTTAQLVWILVLRVREPEGVAETDEWRCSTKSPVRGRHPTECGAGCLPACTDLGNTVAVNASTGSQGHASRPGDPTRTGKGAPRASDDRETLPPTPQQPVPGCP